MSSRTPNLTLIVIVSIVAVVAIVALYFGRDIYTKFTADEVEFQAVTNPPERNVPVSISGEIAKNSSSATDDVNTPEE